MAQTGHACRTWDLTVKADGTVEREKLEEYFDDNCSKWVFQKERGDENGYEHFQCRFTLTKKIRFTNLREKLIEELGITGFHLTVTSKNCIRKDEEYYVTKENTRIEGPWRNNNDTPVEKFWSNVTLRPWQQTIVDEIENYKPEIRTINVIVNTRGNEGKSYLTTYLGVKGKIQEIPVIEDYKDIMQYMYSMYDDANPKAIFIDVPRGITKKAAHGFYAGMESIKRGYIFDTRYKGRQKYIVPPCVYIFTNYYPDASALSKDRWRVRKLEDGILTDTRLFVKKYNKDKKK